MRRVAQKFDMVVQRRMTPFQRWEARRDANIFLVNDNVHIPRADDAEAAHARNAKGLVSALRKARVPAQTVSHVLDGMHAAWQSAPRPSSTPEHR